jgi:type I restriction enzyme S subunit
MHKATRTHWPTISLEQVAEVQTGLAKGKKGKAAMVERPYLRVANVQDGFLDLREIKTIEVDQSLVPRYRLQVGDVLLTEGGDFDKLGRGTVWRGEIADCLHQNHVFAVRVNALRLLPDFLAYQTAGPRGRQYFKACSKQSTNLASINSTQLKQFPVRLPPLAEQRLVVAVLATWDEAIVKTGKLIRANQVRLNHYRHELVTSSRWPTYPLGSVVEPISRPVPTPRTAYKALGIRSHCKGTFQRLIERPEDVDMETVYVVGDRDLIVNITFAWEGAVALARAEDAGCFVSHRFPCFSIDESRVNREFVGYAVHSPRFIHHLRTASPGGAGRNRVLNKRDFLAIEIPIPPKDQQEKIANILGVANRTIDLLIQKKSALEKQKRGLMQKLLTGEWRLPVDVPRSQPATMKVSHV